MSHDRDPNKPGCFGSPLCCAPSASPCNGCPFVASCTEDARERGARLKKHFGVDTFFLTPSKSRKQSPVRSRAKALPADEASNVAGVNKKSLELVGSLKRKGIDLGHSIQNKINPFDREPPAFMRVAVQHLLDGGIDRTALRHQYSRDFGWSDASASSHAGIAIGAILTLGVGCHQSNRVVMA